DPLLLSRACAGLAARARGTDGALSGRASGVTRSGTTHSNAREEPADDHDDSAEDHRRRLSIVIEWANTRLNGVPRFWALLDALRVQWQEILDRVHPETLPAEAARFLESLDESGEGVLVSG